MAEDTGRSLEDIAQAVGLPVPGVLEAIRLSADATNQWQVNYWLAAHLMVTAAGLVPAAAAKLIPILKDMLSVFPGAILEPSEAAEADRDIRYYVLAKLLKDLAG